METFDAVMYFVFMLLSLIYLLLAIICDKEERQGYQKSIYFALLSILFFLVSAL